MLRKFFEKFAIWLNNATNTETGLQDIISLRRESEAIQESMEVEREQYFFIVEDFRDRTKIDFSKAIPTTHDRSCRNCKYWTKEYQLKCAVNPTCESLSTPYKETECLEFEFNVLGQTQPNSLQQEK